VQQSYDAVRDVLGYAEDILKYLPATPLNRAGHCVSLGKVHCVRSRLIIPFGVLMSQPIQDMEAYDDVLVEVSLSMGF